MYLYSSKRFFAAVTLFAMINAMWKFSTLWNKCKCEWKWKSIHEAKSAERRWWSGSSWNTQGEVCTFKSIYSKRNFTSNTLFACTHTHTLNWSQTPRTVSQSVSRRTVIDFPILIEWMQFDDDKSFTFDWIESREAQIMRPEGTRPMPKRSDCNWEKSFCAPFCSLKIYILRWTDVYLYWKIYERTGQLHTEWQHQFQWLRRNWNCFESTNEHIEIN